MRESERKKGNLSDTENLKMKLIGRQRKSCIYIYAEQRLSTDIFSIVCLSSLSAVFGMKILKIKKIFLKKFRNKKNENFEKQNKILKKSYKKN